MPKVLFNGDPGTAWVNNSGRVRYQFFCDWVNTCGVCASYDHAIGSIWPIPLHRLCRCFQLPILIGAESEPFIDFRAKIDSLDPFSQAKVIGRSALELVNRGVIKWEDVVTPTRVRTLQEIVARHKLSIEEMTKAGVRKTIAEKAYASVNTPAEAILKAHRAQLVAKLEGAGLSRDQIIHAAAQKVAERLTIQGPSGTQSLKITAGNLADVLHAIAIQQAALNAPKGIAAKPVEAAPVEPVSKPYKIEVIGDIPLEKSKEFEQWVSEIPKEVHGKISADGNVFIYAKRVEQLDPKLAAEAPDGWPKGATWKNVDGYYDPLKKRIVVAHEHLDPFSKQYEASERVKGVLFHEAGHGLDAALGGASSARRFAEAHAVDLAAMDEATKNALSYFTQNGLEGQSETFAEVFANVLGEDSRFGQTIDKHFPKFTETMRSLLSKLKDAK